MTLPAIFAIRALGRDRFEVVAPVGDFRAPPWRRVAVVKAPAQARPALTPPRPRLRLLLPARARRR
jgi:hypothetical protein